MPAWVGIVIFVVGLGAAIAIHEWGHLITAKWYGMRADRYFVGFGPTLWSTQRGETEYGVKWLLFGGFVRIQGMSPTDERLPPVADAALAPDLVSADRERAADERGTAVGQVPGVPEVSWQRLDDEMRSRGVPDDDRRWLLERTRAEVGHDATAREAAATFNALAERRLRDTGRLGDVRHRVLRGDEDRFFHDRPARERTVVLSAGSVSHFLQAIVLLFVAFWAFGMQPSPEVEEVLPDHPAEAAGLRAGDRIVGVDGVEVDRYEEARTVLASRPGEPVTLTVDRSGERVEVELVTAVVLGDLAPGSELAATGLEPRDRIVAVDGQPIATADDVAAALPEDGDATVAVERVAVTDDGALAIESHEVTVPVAVAEELRGELIGLAGFIPGREGVGPVGALRETFVGEGSFPAMVVGTFAAFGEIFGPEGIGAIPEQLAGGERDPSGASLASPLGLAQIAGEGTTAAGLFFVLGLLAALNVFIGIFNLLPLPPLDGGHLAVLAVEKGVNTVRSARGLQPDYRVDPRAVTAIAVPVIFLLGALFLAVLALDIVNPLRLPQ